MPDETETSSLDQEESFISALRDPSATYEAVREQLEALPSDARFVACDAWLSVASDRALECWRRLVAFEVAIERCISFPCNLADFSVKVLAPLGLNQQSLVDASIIQHLPFDRRKGETIYTAALPIETSIGKAAMYLSVLQASPAVMRAAVYPTADSC